jgi:hypothetical protein
MVLGFPGSAAILAASGAGETPALPGKSEGTLPKGWAEMPFEIPIRLASAFSISPLSQALLELDNRSGKEYALTEVRELWTTWRSHVPRKKNEGADMRGRRWGQLLAVGCMLVLGGCISSAERTRQTALLEQQYQARLAGECQSLGFVQGTPEFSQCVLELHLQNRRSVGPSGERRLGMSRSSVLYPHSP